MLGEALVWGREPAPGATGSAVGPLGRGDAGALGLGRGDAGALLGGPEGGGMLVLAALAWVVAVEAAPQPVSSAAATAATASAPRARGIRSPLAKMAIPASCRTGRPPPP